MIYYQHGTKIMILFLILNVEYRVRMSGFISVFF